MANLLGSVGQNGKNNRPDVRLIQQLLNVSLPDGRAPLLVDGLVGPKTIAALIDFQRRKGLAQTALVLPVDPTWHKLSQGVTSVQTLLPPVAAPVAPPAAWPAKFTFDQFWSFTEPLEGGIAANCMFMVDDLQVATGMGITFTGKANRNAGLAMALALEWVFKPDHPKANQPCTPADITLDYDTVLAKEELGRKGSGFLSEWMKITNCRITSDGLKRAVRNRIVGNINYIKNLRKGPSIGNFDSFPADAQLCVASLTWAMGNEFRFPNFCKACREADWVTASKECTLSNKESTIPRRSAQQQLMMHNAACTALGVGDPDTLHFPNKLSLPTEPEGPHTYRERHHEISLG